jgi:hypothetical protein
MLTLLLRKVLKNSWMTTSTSDLPEKLAQCQGFDRTWQRRLARSVRESSRTWRRPHPDFLLGVCACPDTRWRSASGNGFSPGVAGGTQPLATRLRSAHASVTLPVMSSASTRVMRINHVHAPGFFRFHSQRPAPALHIGHHQPFALTDSNC